MRLEAIFLRRLALESNRTILRFSHRQELTIKLLRLLLDNKLVFVLVSDLVSFFSRWWHAIIEHCAVTSIIEYAFIDLRV